MHNGWDIPGPIGTPVFSVARGVVTHATGNGAPGFANYGKVVVVRHPAVEPPVWSLYAHLSATLVPVGLTVESGQLIGHSGNTNGSVETPGTTFTGNAHLHFELAERAYPMRHEDARIDPQAWFEARGITYTDGRPDVREVCDFPHPEPWIAERPNRGRAATGAVVALGVLLALSFAGKR